MRKLATLFLAGSLAGCAAQTAAVLTAAGISASTVGNIVNIINTAYETGQLFCQTQAGVVGIVDASTGKSYNVTNKTAAEVAKVCGILNGIPVNTPSQPTQVAAVTVALPASVEATTSAPTTSATKTN